MSIRWSLCYCLISAHSFLGGKSFCTFRISSQTFAFSTFPVSFWPLQHSFGLSLLASWVSGGLFTATAYLSSQFSGWLFLRVQNLLQTFVSFFLAIMLSLLASSGLFNIFSFLMRVQLTVDPHSSLFVVMSIKWSLGAPWCIFWVAYLSARSEYLLRLLPSPHFQFHFGHYNTSWGSVRQHNNNQVVFKQLQLCPSHWCAIYPTGFQIIKRKNNV